MMNSVLEMMNSALKLTNFNRRDPSELSQGESVKRPAGAIFTLRIFGFCTQNGNKTAECCIKNDLKYQI